MYITRKRKRYLRYYIFSLCIAGICLAASFSSSSTNEETDQPKGDGIESTTEPSNTSQNEVQEEVEQKTASLLEEQNTGELPQIPNRLPPASDDGYIYINNRRLTIDPDYQASLKDFIQLHGNPKAAIVAVDIKTGRILAMAQGEDTTSWGQKGHTALYTGFPAASIFKNVTAASALDILSFDEDKQIGLRGGCANVHSRGIWLKDIPPSRHYRMTLRLAYGRSCNGFFAKMAVNEVGLGSIEEYASRFGWGHIIPTDFKLKASPIIAPKAAESSIHTVGRFAAGFGLVGLSAMHAAWFTVAIANDGVPKKLTLFADTPAPTNYYKHRLFAKETGVRLRDIMKKTTNGGTASSVFRKRRYRKLKSLVGGKTGTLNGNAPKGLTNWFTGIMPLDNPEIAIAAVTVTGDLWFIKGPHLAAEGFRQWHDLKNSRMKISKSKTSISNDKLVH